MVQVSAQPVAKSGDIQSYISTIIGNMPLENGGDYSVPKPWNLATWGFVLNALLDGDYNEAADSALNIDYQLVEYTENSGVDDYTYYLLENTGSNYWGTYIYNPDHKRRLVIQCPHPRKDFNTGKQGIMAFYEGEAFFYCLSGTHRCNHGWLSECAGKTDVCGAYQNFQISDMAHHDTTLFQDVTDTLFNRYSTLNFIQLHGFTKTNTDPYVILSNGTDQIPNTDYLATLETQLFNEDNTLTFKTAHIETDWTRLVGFTNTQGRLINGSNDPCGASAQNTSGRFLHVEQEKTKLRANSTGWEKMSNAIINTFPNNPLPVELTGFSAVVKDAWNVELRWATATEVNNDHFEVQKSKDGRDWERVGSVEGKGTTLSPQSYIYNDKTPYRGLSYYRLTQVDYDGTRALSELVSVNTQPEFVLRMYPNPCQDQLKIRHTETKKVDVRFYDAMGKLFTPMLSTSSYETTVDTKVLPKGVYWVTVRRDELFFTEQVVVE